MDEVRRLVTSYWEHEFVCDLRWTVSGGHRKCSCRVGRMLAAINAAKKERDQGWAAAQLLLHHTRHAYDCGVLNTPVESCTCGLSDALDQYEQMLKQA